MKARDVPMRSSSERWSMPIGVVRNRPGQQTLPEPSGAVDRMASIDLAWLEMDGPHNPMVVNAVLEVEGVRDVEGLVTFVAERMLRWPRFRQ